METLTPRTIVRDFSLHSERTTETHRRFHGGGARDRVRGRAACVPDSRRLRSRGTPLLALLAMLCLPSAALAQFTITRVSSPTFYEDAGLTGMYAGYEITNTSAATYPDLWVDIGNFTGGFVSLAQNEDGITHLGSTAPG